MPKSKRNRVGKYEEEETEDTHLMFRVFSCDCSDVFHHHYRLDLTELRTFVFCYCYCTSHTHTHTHSFTVKDQEEGPWWQEGSDCEYPRGGRYVPDSVLISLWWHEEWQDEAAQRRSQRRCEVSGHWECPESTLTATINIMVTLFIYFSVIADCYSKIILMVSSLTFETLVYFL